MVIANDGYKELLLNIRNTYFSSNLEKDTENYMDTYGLPNE